MGNKPQFIVGDLPLVNVLLVNVPQRRLAWVTRLLEAIQHDTVVHTYLDHPTLDASDLGHVQEVLHLRYLTSAQPGQKQYDLVVVGLSAERFVHTMRETDRLQIALRSAKPGGQVFLLVTIDGTEPRMVKAIAEEAGRYLAKPWICLVDKDQMGKQVRTLLVAGRKTSRYLGTTANVKAIQEGFNHGYHSDISKLPTSEILSHPSLIEQLKEEGVQPGRIHTLRLPGSAQEAEIEARLEDERAVMAYLLAYEQRLPTPANRLFSPNGQEVSRYSVQKSLVPISDQHQILRLMNGAVPPTRIQTENGLVQVGGYSVVENQLYAHETDWNNTDTITVQADIPRLAIVREDGLINVVTGENGLIQFMEHHGAQLTEASRDSIAPLYQGTDVARWEQLDRYYANKRMPGIEQPGLLPAQRHTIRAVLKAFRRGQDRVMIRGNMGTGKTGMGLAVANEMNAYPVLVITMPPLVKQWQDEVKTLLPEAVPFILTRRQQLAQVEALVREGKKVVVIASKDTIKKAMVEKATFTFQYNVQIRKGLQETIHYLTRARERGMEDEKKPMEPIIQRLERILERRTKIAACPHCGFDLRLPGAYGKGVVVTKDDRKQVEALERMLKREPYCPTCNRKLVHPVLDGNDPTTRKVTAQGIVNWLRHRRRYFGLLILDEFHKYRDPKTAQTKMARAALRASRKMLALTGTFVGNNATSMYDTVGMLNPSMLGDFPPDSRGRNAFAAVYGYLETLTVKRPDGSISTKIRETSGVRPQVLRYLHGCTVFVNHGDLAYGPHGLHLPPLEVHVERVDDPELWAAMEGIYKEARKAVQEVLEEARGDIQTSGVAKMKGLRTASSIYGMLYHLAIDTPNNPHAPVVASYKDAYHGGRSLVIDREPIFPDDKLSAKEERLVQILSEAIEAGDNVIVTLNQTRGSLPERTMAVIQEALKLGKKEVRFLDTSVKPVDRPEWIEDALDDGMRVMLVHPVAIAHGLNLVRFNRIVMTQLHPNVTDISQVMARIHRIGQDRKCHFHFLVHESGYEVSQFNGCMAGIRSANMVQASTELVIRDQVDVSMNQVQQIAQAVLEQIAPDQELETEHLDKLTDQGKGHRSVIAALPVRDNQVAVSSLPTPTRSAWALYQPITQKGEAV